MQAELAKGGTFIYEDLSTGFRYRMFEIHPGEISAPDDEEVQLWKMVADIQRRSRTVIPQPQRPFFTDDDVIGIATVEEIMTSGRTLRRVVSARVGIKTGILRRVIGKDKGGQLGEFRQERKHHFEPILDTPVPLGRAVVHCSSVRIAQAELEILKEKLRSLPESDDDTPIEVGIEPTDGYVFSITFPDWPNDTV